MEVIIHRFIYRQLVWDKWNLAGGLQSTCIYHIIVWLICDSYIHAAAGILSLLTCVVFVVAVVLQKRASKVRLVPFGFETPEIQALTFSLSLLWFCEIIIKPESCLPEVLGKLQEAVLIYIFAWLTTDLRVFSVSISASWTPIVPV